MNPDYQLAYWGLCLILITLLVQQVVASASKASQPGSVPGKIDDTLSHDSFVFRAHRTFMNSLENMPLLLGTVFLAVFVGADTLWTAILVWVFALGRLIHMLLYYAIATERNPSPRSYFFALAFIANVALLGVVGVALI